MTHGIKEWDVVCRALECGRQTFLLRAGGIHDAARWHEELPCRAWLMPTDFHEQHTAVTWVPDAPDPDPFIKWRIRSWVEVIRLEAVTDARILTSLAPHHILSPALVEKRYLQNNPPCVWVIVLRVHLLDTAWVLPDRPELGGCRSVVPLPEPLINPRNNPVLDDQTFLNSLKIVENLL
ncbi:MAG: DUF1802 family protein [Candidatus Methylacidiphilales bacterium]